HGGVNRVDQVDDVPDRLTVQDRLRLTVFRLCKLCHQKNSFSGVSQEGVRYLRDGALIAAEFRLFPEVPLTDLRDFGLVPPGLRPVEAPPVLFLELFQRHRVIRIRTTATRGWCHCSPPGFRRRLL